MKSYIIFCLSFLLGILVSQFCVDQKDLRQFCYEKANGQPYIIKADIHQLPDFNITVVDTEQEADSLINFLNKELEETNKY